MAKQMLDISVLRGHNKRMEDTTECLHHWPEQETCSGGVESHPALSGTGTVIAYCERHWAEAIERDQQLRVNFPDSEFPPAWFDEANAGERWNDDY